MLKPHTYCHGILQNYNFESAGQHEIMEILIRVLLCTSSKHMDVFIKIVRLNYR